MQMPDGNRTQPKALKNFAVRRSSINLPKGILSEFNVFKVTGATVQELKPTNCLAVTVKDEILSGEHSDQLAHDSGFDPLRIFLTPNGDMPSHSDYVPANYGVVCGECEAFVEEGMLPGCDDLEYSAPHPSGVPRKHRLGPGATLLRKIFP